MNLNNGDFKTYYVHKNTYTTFVCKITVYFFRYVIQILFLCYVFLLLLFYKEYITLDYC